MNIVGRPTATFDHQQKLAQNDLNKLIGVALQESASNRPRNRTLAVSNLEKIKKNYPEHADEASLRIKHLESGALSTCKPDGPNSPLTETEKEKLFEFNSKHVKKGNEYALYFEGDMYLNGYGTQQDDVKAVDIFLQLTLKSLSAGLSETIPDKLTSLFEEGRGITGENRPAVVEFLQGRKECVNAQLALVKIVADNPIYVQVVKATLSRVIDAVRMHKNRAPDYYQSELKDLADLLCQPKFQNVLSQSVTEEVLKEAADELGHAEAALATALSNESSTWSSFLPTTKYYEIAAKGGIKIADDIKSALAGNKDKAYIVGTAYLSGDQGVQQDIQKANYYFKLAEK